MTLNTRSFVFIIAALVIAGIAAFLARSWLSAERSGPVTAEKPAVVVESEILVAAANLPAGRILQKGDLAWANWPEKGLPDQYIRKVTGNEMQDLMGAVVRSGILAREPLTTGGVVKKDDRGFMSAILTPGMRAVSIRVSPTTGVSGFVFPGDRVDLILTQSISHDSGAKVRASETILTNIRVLGIDQRSDDQENAPNVAKTATLEVTPAQAEQIALLSDMGEISLSLRSLGDPEVKAANDATLGKGAPEKGNSITWDRDISRVPRPGGGNAKSEGPSIEVTRGSKSTRVSIGG